MQRPYPYPNMFESRSFVTLRYAMTAVSNVLLALAMFFFPEHRGVLLFFFVAAFAETAAIAVCNIVLHIFRRQGYHRELTLLFLYFDIFYLLALDGVSRVYFRIDISPIFLIAIITLQAAYFFRSIAPARFRVLPSAVWITGYFIGVMALFDVLLFLFHSNFNIVFFFVKVIIIVSVHAFVARMYDSLLSHIADRLEENRRLNDRLIGSMKFIVSGEIFSVMLSDMKGMMRTISTALNGIRAHPAEPIEVERHAPVIAQSVTDTETVIDQFLSYIRLDPYRIETVDVRETVREALAFVRVSRRRTLTAEFETSGVDDGAPLFINASKYRLLSVFLSLLHRAVDSPADSEKHVYVGITAAETIAIRIVDNGRTDNAAVFSAEPDQSDTPGLFFVREYITGSLGGTVTAEKANGRTVLTVHLPPDGHAVANRIRTS